MSSKLEFSRGDRIAEKYEVVDLLDESPVGRTYRVKHLKTGRYVRLLMLRPSIAGRDQKEQILRIFKNTKENPNPHLVKLGELGEHAGLAYVTFEDFEGATLRELLQEYKIAGRQFGVTEAAQVTMQILEAANALHASGIVLRALRPEHVLIDVRYTGPRRQTFVANCKVLGGGFWDLVPNATLAEDEFTRGEAQYLAPELKSFEPVPTPRSDIYSAGVIFYEMLVGAAPVGTFQLPRSRRPELPRHVNTVVELALAQAPEDRYQKATDFITDIQRTFEDAVLAGSIERSPLITPTGWSLIVAAVVLLGAIVYSLQGDPMKEAQSLDSVARQLVLAQQARPTTVELKAIEAQHPPNMVYIPAGPYISGRMHSERRALTGAREPLTQLVELDAFLIDIFEHPNAPGQVPLANVSFAAAEKACAATGKRLCTAGEWEKACKGPMSFIYGYGDVYDQDFCGEGVEDRYASGKMKDCKTGWRAYDMSGNFREWTSSAPSGKESRRIVKDGIRSNPEKGTRCAASTDESVGFSNSALSFRCCRSADAPPID